MTKVLTLFLSEISQVIVQNDLYVLKPRACPLYRKSDY